VGVLARNEFSRDRYALFLALAKLLIAYWRRRRRTIERPALCGACLLRVQVANQIPMRSLLAVVLPQTESADAPLLLRYLTCTL
jgi:hypothetical protein